VAFAKDGCTKIAICDQNAAGLEETAQLIADVNKEVKVLQVLVDLRDEGQVEGMVTIAVAEFGRIDYAVNAAGMLAQ
jgi:NAD(P)-dependent dehydrogenase (short-subunit alcohol dehydrogenase family)